MISETYKKLMLQTATCNSDSGFKEVQDAKEAL